MGEVIIRGREIGGVSISPLRQIKDDRGMVMHMLRSDSPNFDRFGEIYFSITLSGAVKAWKRHSRMTQRLAVPVGEIKLVVYDGRPDSATKGAVQEITTGVDRYALVVLPPNIWYGFTGNGVDAMIANCSDIPHDPAESEKIPPDSDLVPYKW